MALTLEEYQNLREYEAGAFGSKQAITGRLSHLSREKYGKPHQLSVNNFDPAHSTDDDLLGWARQCVCESYDSTWNYVTGVGIGYTSTSPTGSGTLYALLNAELCRRLSTHVGADFEERMVSLLPTPRIEP